MILKTNLHFHTGDDPEDSLGYDTKEGIDKASELGFDVLALTCHNKVIHTKEYEKYATSKGILLISGIELNVGEEEKEYRHLIVLNCSKDAEKIDTFADLEKYKKNNPEIFVLAPHPYYPGIVRKTSLMEYAEMYSHLFDAIEHSWFYSKHINRNKPAEKLSKKVGLPMVATSDTHFFDFLDTDYCLIEAREKTPRAVFEGIRRGSFKNVSRPKKLIREMSLCYGSYLFKKVLRSMRN